MVEVLKRKIVSYKNKSCMATLCVQITWDTSNYRINTPFGVFPTIIAGDQKSVFLYKRAGIKFNAKKIYFVRIMDKRGKYVTVLDYGQTTIRLAKKQFETLSKI